MEFDNEKKFLRLENNPPPPPITFLMVRRLRYHGDGGRKRHLKSDFTLFETAARLSQLAHFVQCRQTFLDLNS